MTLTVIYVKMGYNINIFNRRILQTKSEQNPDTCLRNYTHTHLLTVWLSFHQS